MLDNLAARHDSRLVPSDDNNYYQPWSYHLVIRWLPTKPFPLNSVTMRHKAIHHPEIQTRNDSIGKIAKQLTFLHSTYNHTTQPSGIERGRADIPGDDDILNTAWRVFLLLLVRPSHWFNSPLYHHTAFNYHCQDTLADDDDSDNFRRIIFGSHSTRFEGFEAWLGTLRPERYVF
jgi:hypothetical protein